MQTKSKSIQKKKSTRKLNRKSTRKSVRKYVRKCKFQESFTENFKVLESLNWDITTFPDKSNIAENILETKLCKGQIKLLLPVVSSNDSNNILVYYEEKVKRKVITFSHILEKIYQFYNEEKVVLADLTYVSIASSMSQFSQKKIEEYKNNHTSLKTLKFKDFVAKDKYLSSIKKNEKGSFTVELV